MEGGAQFVDFMDKATELRLGLPGSDTAMEKPAPQASGGVKRSLPEDKDENLTMNKSRGHEAAPPAKCIIWAQVVGWPPIRSYRKNSLQAKKTEAEAGGLYVKVSMNGVPYLRKIDLKVFKGYKELREALEVMFKCFSLGELLGMEKCSKSDYAIAYEDKDGDWMLAGDVPWEMFTSSCKRLRIMKGSEAKGLGSGQ